ncbi:DegT/DnrJ/EryC1/StrS family aminotransferase [Janthinobacterium sp. SUN128]|uniref:DegT/DnrJ/EryC1/StrS family aminotransferase n=1 Tax=Janthinobacterium sp. SUN128 TaxID=3014790 RepID=UPI002713C298|nr:DegT/DnrJ/EryC1/StrS family aminotransferase [Janthinobacterium sp. SUN128]MDO8035562.1 DegT/DnrJ/EryC1/StrS family aminotransferase [Janthinobacterium sp. SUN128]
MNIPFLDLGAAYRELKTEVDAAVAGVLSSGYYIGGPEVDAFETEFAAYCEVEHAIGVANGLDGLHLALLAMDVRPGDEVIVPSNTFIATWLAVSQCGAIPVPVEPNEATHNLDPKRIEAAITSKTKVIIPVHLYGQPADLDPILALARNYGLMVLEDAAQAHGSRYKGKKIGGHGDAAAWSFYPGKNLGGFGDGGAVTTRHAHIAERIRILRNYGSKVKYVNDVRGFNSRLDPIQATVLRVKLRHLDGWNIRRKQIAAQYTAALSNTGLVLPVVADGCDPVWHLYVVRSLTRDDLQVELTKAGVNSLVHYPIPPHKQLAYKDFISKQNEYPIADLLAAQVLSLPVGPHMSSEDVDQVILKINKLTT